MGKKVSAILPAYNAENTIGLAIESVLAQTHSNLELIVVDDASTDGTVDVVRSYIDERIKLVCMAGNGGSGIARDAAIAISMGDWIAVIDADDAWAHTRLEKMLALAPECKGDCILVDDIAQCYEADGRLVPWRAIRGRKSRFLDEREKGLADLLSETGYLIKPIIPRRSITALQLRHTELQYGEDAQFFIRLIKRAEMKIRCLNECLYLYRMTPGAASTMAGNRVIMRDMLIELTSELDFSAAERKAIARKIRAQERHIEYEPFGIALKKKHYWEATKYGIRNPRCILLFIWRLPKSLLFRATVTSRGGSARPLH